MRMLAYRLTNKLADVFTKVDDEMVTAFEHKKAASNNRMLATHNGINNAKLSFNLRGKVELAAAA